MATSVLRRIMDTYYASLRFRDVKRYFTQARQKRQAVSSSKDNLNILYNWVQILKMECFPKYAVDINYKYNRTTLL